MFAKLVEDCDSCKLQEVGSDIYYTSLRLQHSLFFVIRMDYSAGNLNCTLCEQPFMNSFYIYSTYNDTHKYACDDCDNAIKAGFKMAHEERMVNYAKASLLIKTMAGPDVAGLIMKHYNNYIPVIKS